jgi:hypothetical protein
LSPGKKLNPKENSRLNNVNKRSKSADPIINTRAKREADEKEIK